MKGNLVWNGDIKANELTSFSAQIKFTEVGHMTIEARAIRLSSSERGAIALGRLYVNVFQDHSELGWLPKSVGAKNVSVRNGRRS